MFKNGNLERFSFIENSEKCNDGVIEAIYQNNDKNMSKIKVQLSAIDGFIGRIKITEVDSIYRRVDVFQDLWKDLQNEPKIDKFIKTELLFKNGKADQCIMDMKNNVKLKFKFQPMSITIEDDVDTFLSINEDGFLQMEPPIQDIVDDDKYNDKNQENNDSDKKVEQLKFYKGI